MIDECVNTTCWRWAQSEFTIILPLEFNCEQTLITKNILTSIETVNNGFVFFFIHEMYENNSPL